MKKPKVYLASPLGFVPYNEGYRADLHNLLESIGVEVLDPWDGVGQSFNARIKEIRYAYTTIEERQAELAKINKEIARRNAIAIRDCDTMIAILDGPDVDSGTASEIGYAAALEKKGLIGVRTDFRKTGDNEGAIVNLQVQYFINLTGGAIVTDMDAFLVTCILVWNRVGLTTLP